MKVVIENLRKNYDKTIAVEDISICINSGEFVSVLGPSGCGKSTLLYMLAGIVEPTSGIIKFDEQDVVNIPIEKRNIGMVFQNYSLYPHMTVSENLAFPLRMKGINKRSANEEVEKISRLLHINDMLHKRPKELSGGQQQRVAIGRALIKKPDLLLMDEPFSNLDAALRVEMREEIRQLQKKTGITTLFVTHDQEEALSISDRIMLMNRGQLVQFSTPNEMYDNPATIFAANFVGSPRINIVAPDKFQDIMIDSSDKKGIKAVGIRPEDILILTDNENLKEDYLEGIILDIRLLGRETHYKVSIGDTILRGITSNYRSIKQNQGIRLKFKKVHYLYK